MSCDLMMRDSSFLEDLAIADMSVVTDQDDSRSTVDDSSPSRSPVPMILGKDKDCDQDKDSGIEFCGEDSPQPLEGLVLPDKELAKGIVDIVEYYFSDANLLKDTFLLKHVRRNKEGYVSLKLITNFRKVKTFTRDWQVVAHSLKHHSKLMQVNDQCTKVRRVVPLPSYDETQPSRTVLITGLPSAAGSVDNGALELVSRFGDLVLVRLVKPADCSSEQNKDLKKFFARRPDLVGTPCFVAEFSKHESAARALKEINEGASSSSYTAYSLGDKTQVKQTKIQPPPTATKQKQTPVPPSTANKKTRKSTKKVQQSSKAVDSSDSEHQYSPEMRRRSSSSISSGYFSSSPRHTDYFERRSNARTQSASAGSTTTPVVRPRTRLDSAPVTTLSVEASPWVQRRIAAAKTQSPPSGVIVIREPRGPDGSNGFQPRRHPLLAACS